MPTLQITALGGLNIYLDGSPVTGLRSRKAEALLVYLAANPGAQPRPKLAEMLWEDRPHAQSLSNLRVILANLRKELAPYLHITRDAAAMNPDAPWTYDAVRFDALLAQGQIGDALALYRGDFLDGFYLRGARGFERWQSERRRYYQQQVRAALRAQIQTLETQHDPEAALPHARRLANLDPFDETAQMTLLRLLA
ncbi:MAG TPA: hypothetical protein ENJ02_00140, partial [Chloroflexi bacterium]|nr:hypothetical protein [Chloroflexota bacterium]